MEVQEPRLEKARGFDEELSKVSDDMGFSKVVCRSSEPSEKKSNMETDKSQDFGNIVENQERVERLMKKEVLGLELKGKKVKKIVEKHGSKLEFDNPTHLSSNDQSIKSLFKDQPKATINKLETSGPAISLLIIQDEII
ncbi:hypothetical protein K2173_009597 [Erythroxylum novogranatense]|uniref:Uncharacterized protein n=1 Tax=Erythroxylum novogranatense TaxID=1862640 RepID=A0AAV8U5K5_9ROSI|nr:hypothetical protein K2173_009597 [Erythroxylum novogranatense]